jgi:hypothetical protein
MQAVVQFVRTNIFNLSNYTASVRAQGTTEYLIILAVVIVIALIVVSIMGWMPGMGANITEKQSRTYWASLSPLAITSYSVFSDGSFKLVLRNTGMQALTLSAIYLNDENVLKNTVTVQPASTSTVYGYVTNSANRCTAGTTFTYNVKLKYGSQYLQNKSLMGEKPLVGKCGDNGTIAVWHLDEGTGTTSTDSVQGLQINLNGTWVTGKIGNAFQFVGGGWVGTTFSDAIGNGVTYVFWFKLPDTSDTYGTFFCTEDVSNTSLEDNLGQTNYGDATCATDYFVSSLNVNDAQWHMFAFSKSSNSLMCRDNTCVSVGDATSAIPNIKRIVFNGGCGCGYSNFSQGIIIDEIQIYNRALSESEIKALYNAYR